jgi:hypothetical protein
MNFSKILSVKVYQQSADFGSQPKNKVNKPEKNMKMHGINLFIYVKLLVINCNKTLK